MKEFELLEKINNIDEDLLEEAARAGHAEPASGENSVSKAVESLGSGVVLKVHDSKPSKENAKKVSRNKWIKQAVALLAACLVLAAGVVTFVILNQPGTKSSAPLETGNNSKDIFHENSAALETDSHSKGMSTEDPAALPANYPDYASLTKVMTFEEILQSCDLLIVGTCTEVTPHVPVDRAISFTFSVDKVLGGQYDPGTRLKPGEITLGFTISYPNRDPADYAVFTAGHQYLIPVDRIDLVFEPYYSFSSAALILDLTEGEYRNYFNKVDVPAGKTLEEYASEVFNSVDRTEETRKAYADEFEEFYEESDFICRMKVVEVVVADDVRSITACEFIEAYKGRAEDIYSFRQDGLVTIAVRTGTVEAGGEYIIGFKAGNNFLATPDAVKPVDEALIRKIREKNGE